MYRLVCVSHEYTERERDDTQTNLVSTGTPVDTHPQTNPVSTTTLVSTGMRPLSGAARSGNRELVEWLLKCGADVDGTTLRSCRI